MFVPPTCQFEHELSPCDGGKVFVSGDSEADTYRYCRRHYRVVRLLRKEAAARFDAQVAQEWAEFYGAQK